MPVKFSFAFLGVTKKRTVIKVTYLRVFFFFFFLSFGCFELWNTVVFGAHTRHKILEGCLQSQSKLSGACVLLPPPPSLLHLVPPLPGTPQPAARQLYLIINHLQLQAPLKGKLQREQLVTSAPCSLSHLWVGFSRSYEWV